MDGDDDEHEMIIVDAGRLCWRVGLAGDDAPSREWTVEEAPGRSSCWSGLRAWCACMPHRDLRAVFSVNVFDDADGPVVAEIASECFGLNGKPPIADEIVLASQEMLALYATGRIPGMHACMHACM